MGTSERFHDTIDARGLSCPEPAILTEKAMARAGKGEVRVLVDSAASRDNIARIAQLNGWQAEVRPAGDGEYCVVLRK